MTSELRPYPEYKDSGLAWLGRVPAGWDVRRNGRQFAQRNETGFGSLPILEVSLRTGVRVRDMDDMKRKQVMSDREKYKRAVKGDIAYNMMRMWQGAVGVAPVDGLVSPAYVVARPYPEVEPRYFSYLFRTDAYKNEVDGYSRGIVKDRNRLYWEDFKRMPSCFPPPDEQKAIADYLDANAAMVRRFIRNWRRLIEVLNEQKQAIINRAVTRGLDPSVSLKPSGIDWLGDIPQHWEVLRLKNVANVVLGKMLKTTASPGHKLRPYLRSANIQWWKPRLDDVAEMWFSDAEMDLYRLSTGDLLVSEGGEVGRACLWNGQIEECYIQNSVHKVSPNDRVRSQFLLLQFFLLGKSGRFEAITNRVSIGHLTREKLVAVYVAVPPVNEQDQIVNRVAESTRSINVAIDRAQREIDLIREYRTRLITDVVTGKLDVRQSSAVAAPARSTTRKANVHFRRAVFAAEIVQRLHDEPTFGHVKFEKLIFLCEKRCGVDTGSTYYRQAAGPYDNRALRSIDTQIKKQKWFEGRKNDKGYRYLPLENVGGHKKYFDRYFGDVEPRMDAVIRLFRKAKTVQCEIVATLYAAWEDLLAEGEDVSDTQIVQEVLHRWHPSKQKIAENRWRRALGWMKKKGLTPETGVSSVSD